MGYCYCHFLYFINDSALNYFNYDQDHYGGAWPFAPSC